MTSSYYLIPAERHRVEDVIRRSRFITTLGHAADVASAKVFVERVKAEFPDATHNCWAFVAGPPGSTAQVGMSDDGEPHGTAGRPMLTALLHSEVGEIVAVVTRYYGGVKLGKGGLSRAYSGGVTEGVRMLSKVRRVSRTLVEVRVEYGAVEGLKRLIEESDGLLEGEEYGEDVRLEAAIPTAELEEFEKAVASLTAGRGRVDY